MEPTKGGGGGVLRRPSGSIVYIFEGKIGPGLLSSELELGASGKGQARFESTRRSVGKKGREGRRVHPTEGHSRTASLVRGGSLVAGGFQAEKTWPTIQEEERRNREGVGQSSAVSCEEHDHAVSKQREGGGSEMIGEKESFINPPGKTPFATWFTTHAKETVPISKKRRSFPLKI